MDVPSAGFEALWEKKADCPWRVEGSTALPDGLDAELLLGLSVIVRGDRGNQSHHAAALAVIKSSCSAQHSSTGPNSLGESRTPPELSL